MSRAPSLPVAYVDAYMLMALEQAEIALAEGEVPVGCVLVPLHLHDDPTTYANTSSSSSSSSAVVMGRNATNKRRHALAHAEFVAVEDLLARTSSACLPTGDVCGSSTKSNNHGSNACSSSCSVAQTSSSSSSSLTSLAKYVLYVSVEPCIMCAAMLLYNRIAGVFFGCGNPRFGGNGTVLSLHDAHHNNFVQHNHAYPSEGGHRAGEAIALLQNFYARENTNAPVPKRRKKEAGTATAA